MHSKLLALAILILFSTSIKAEMPDFYSEAASVSKRAGHSEAPNEVVDPFSGTLNIVHNDLVVPGNGGLDIRIQRTYSSQNTYRKVGQQNDLRVFQARTNVGLGWQMHFGRIRMPKNADPCINGSIDITDNPIVEMPSGEQQVLFCNNYPNTYGTNASFVTKSHGVANYISNTARLNGFKYIDPQGIKYTMSYRVSGGTGLVTDDVWYATRVEDRNGNYYTISYRTASDHETILPSRIRASDGRVIDFVYSDSNNANKARLSQLKYNGKTWTYNYTKITNYEYQSGTNHQYYQLNNVDLPGNLSKTGRWVYEYYNRSSGAAGNRLIRKITYPQGGTVTYDYKYHCFIYTNCSDSSTYNSLVVKSKIRAGRNVASGTWNYSYSEANTFDTTTVTGPNNKIIYKHYGLYQFQNRVAGSSTYTNQNDMLWRVGLLSEKKIQTLSGNTLQTEQYDYQPFKISNEYYSRYPYTISKRVSDPDVFTAYLVEKRIIRDGKTYTTKFENFTDNINPHKITEIGQATRVKTLDYYPRNNGQNIVSQVDDEQYSNNTNRKITRTFDNKGNLKTENKYGVLTTYGYDGQGNITSIKNARNKTTYFGNYYRGTARTENQPESVSITRTVDSFGNITSINNGRGHVTQYNYDDLNRLTKVYYPQGSTTNITWSTTSRVLTRGSYSQELYFDGFGRTTCTKTENIYIGQAYNAAGNQTFKTFPNFTSCTSSTRNSYTYDALNRLRRTTFPDNNYTEITYQNNNIQRLRDERGGLFYNSYRSYSSPDEQELIKITGPNSLNLNITRNILGQTTSVNRNGINRTFGYGSSIFLLSESHPETGTTTYGRDALGNLTSKRVGNSATTYYSYDDLNRLTLTNYPNSTPDISLTYDKNNNLKTINSGIANLSYTYDPNDNLIKEKQTIDGKSYYLSYSYTDLDHLNSITYADGGVVNYTSNDLGWPTKAAPYINNISYDAFGRPTQFVYANGRTQSQTYWSRGWPKRTIVDGGISDRERSYDAAGNLTVLNDLLNNLYDRNMTYDGLNRLKTANGAWGSGTINYSTDDDITSKAMGTNSLNYNYSSSNKISSVSGLQSFITPANYSYDVYGNITQKANNSFGWTYTYDDASNLRQVRDKSNTLLRSYDYSGQKQRIKSTKPDETRIHIVSKSGQLMNEFVISGTKPNIANVYVGNRLIAELESQSGPVAPATVYGWGYGNSANKNSYSTTFSLSKMPEKINLCVNGYGISYSTEVSVKINGTLIGYMNPGGDPTESCFEVQSSLLVLGSNTILFTQAVSGQTWGVSKVKAKPIYKNTFLPAIYLLLSGEEAN